ncbi:MAG: DUF4268 domain-containing protein [Rhodothermaceae bacterium]|nr:DUF4268 domain-containing protein [Bacteroidota bacterium]MXW13978.1 DUF4268 domain-containing protein [Rhodothermaceae bacterium]MXW33846.1 DUF4268 domain-containing protein [Rhodothermaceae bacterium]MYC04992.1 DUF4268 domain-containing protein [Rhodothermaceae bacterium]MYE64139.1 DUF4268 domain-containing protein [Rhodothermaceae bacterium]
MEKKDEPHIHSLEPVNLRKLWQHEAHDFTPWLAQNIDRLGKVLNLNLEVVKPEKWLQEAGYVDIYAKQAETNVRVVIENQLEGSDNSHCIRLLGYAAKSEASILVWVAQNFDRYHLNILEWLNEADTIDVYAVKVRAYRIGEVLAADFETVVEPPQSRGTATLTTEKSANTLYAEFYRPLVAKLAQEGIQSVGKGGWRGRYRSFETGVTGAKYATRAQDKMIQVFLSLTEEMFRVLKEHRKEINRKLQENLSWTEENNWFRIILESNDQFSLAATEKEWEGTRGWMANSMISLRDALHPYLAELKKQEEGDAADEIVNVD